MSFKTRLQAFVESQQKIQIWYGMGCHNTVTGRVLSVDHDHIDIEAYTHESDGQIHIRRILVPLHLILHIDITSAETEDLDDDSSTYIEHRDKRNASPSIDLPDAPSGYAIRILSQLNTSYSNRLSRMSAGPGGMYFAIEGSVWFVDSYGQSSEYARIRGGNPISGLCFDRKGILYVATTQGTIYKIDPNKSGRILAQIDGSLTGGGTFLSDIVIGIKDDLYVSNFPSNTGGIFRVDRIGEYEVFVGGPGHGTHGLLLSNDGFIWSLEHATGCLVKRTLTGKEITRMVVAEPESFCFADGYDGNLAMDNMGRIYLTAGKAGSVIRVLRNGQSEVFLSGLLNPTGIAFNNDGVLFVLEAGRSRVLRIATLDKANSTASATALS